ncbi:MAG: hypothetical protein HKN82_12540 [Akkermansiaceae bacterium]|nr:hypothetical protein [Akkermansiaceae bacterium]NNM29873.1 hypothetical protein [Akkermansiaceae bacterium]
MKRTGVVGGAVLLGAVVLAAGAARADEGAGAAELEGSTREIIWGEHWAGPKVRGAKSLEGKVVLLKIWGG